LLGSGQTVAVYATKAGLTKLRASLPNGKYADCEVLITAAKQFSFLTQSVRLQPGESKTIAFSVSPPDVDISFVTQNDSYFNYTWSLASKTVTVTDKQEGTASLNGVTNYGTKAALSVICTWDYTFSIGKSAIVAEPRPDPSVPDKFIIPYTVNPPNADIAVTLTNDAIVSYVVDKTNKRITLTPKAEGTGNVLVAAKNPGDGGKEFDSKTCALSLKYDAVTLRPVIESDGNFSRYDDAVNTLTIGDGETVRVSFSVAEPNVNYQIESVTMEQGTSSPLNFILTIPPTGLHSRQML
jgi:hypothetical protein